MFSATFNQFATSPLNTNTTDINAIWGSADFKGKITPANVGGADPNAVFLGTFFSMTSLTGNAQTFINTKLGGITPSTSARTFYNCTKLADYAALHTNWKSYP